MHTPVNHVHLIGSLTTEPAIITLANGHKMARFAITTRELRKGLEGKIESDNQWHKIVAQGQWVQVLEEFAEKGVQLAIEGKLRSRFYKDQHGRNQYTSEIEVKDLVFLGHGRLAQSA